MSSSARVPLTAIKAVASTARPSASACHPPKRPMPAPAPKTEVQSESTDPLQAGISITEIERRLRAYKRDDRPFSVKEFERLTGLSPSTIYAYGHKKMLDVSTIGARKKVVSIEAAARYIYQTANRTGGNE